MKTFLDFESLESFLERWDSWAGGEYDFGGIVLLMCACIRNITANAIEGDWESLAERMTDADRHAVEAIRRWAHAQQGTAPGRPGAS